MNPLRRFFIPVLFGSVLVSLTTFVVFAINAERDWDTDGAILSALSLASTAVLAWACLNFREYRTKSEAQHTYRLIWEYLVRHRGTRKHIEFVLNDDSTRGVIRVLTMPHPDGSAVDIVRHHTLSDNLVHCTVLRVAIDNPRGELFEYILNGDAPQLALQLQTLRVWPGGDETLAATFTHPAIEQTRIETGEAYDFLMLLHRAKLVAAA